MGWYAIGFVGALITFIAVSAGRSAILNDMTTERWMSRKNYTSLIKASYNGLECANIFICDDSAGTEMIFMEFISIYRYDYTLNDAEQGCDSYFLVATSDESLTNTVTRLTLNSNAEILIVMDKDVDEKSGIFNVSMYLRSNVNIAAPNGLWTLSENFFDYRAFKRVSRYDEMVRKGGIVNLEGQLLHATTFYNPPLCFLRTTVNRTVNGIETQFFIAKDETERDGVELILFMLIAEKLNFTWTIRKPNGVRRYGRRNGSVWDGGMIDQMIRSETQFAFSGIQLSMDHYEFTNLTTPWNQLQVHFLVPRPKPHASFWALTKPISAEIWAAIVSMLIAQSVCVYARAWINPRIPTRFRSFNKTWIEMTGRLVGTCAPRKIRCLKLQIQLWHLFGILVVTAYSSNLAARLATRDYDKRIDNLEDFVKANLTWGRDGRPPVFKNFFNLSDPYAKQLPGRYQTESGEAQRHEKIKRGNYAIMGNLVSSAFFPYNTIRNEDLKNYRLMKESIDDYYATFAIVPWLAKSVNKLMLWMQETGLVQYHINDVLHRRMSYALREVLIEHDLNNGHQRILELTPLGAGFAFYIVGLFISTVVFCLELRSVGGSRSIREVLLDIKKNREIRQAKELKRKQVYSAFKKLKRKRYGFD